MDQSSTKCVTDNQEDTFGTLMESEDYEAGLLVGLAGLRDQGLLLDTCLWAEGEKYQVGMTVPQLEYVSCIHIRHCEQRTV